MRSYYSEAFYLFRHTFLRTPRRAVQSSIQNLAMGFSDNRRLVQRRKSLLVINTIYSGASHIVEY